MPAPTPAAIRAEHQDWADTRLERIDALCQYLTHAVVMARRENDPAGWHSRHVVWALRRLDRLGYTFPELDDINVAIPAHIIAA